MSTKTSPSPESTKESGSYSHSHSLSPPKESGSHSRTSPQVISPIIPLLPQSHHRLALYSKRTTPSHPCLNGLKPDLRSTRGREENISH